MSQTVRIVPSVLRQQVEDGMKLKPLAEHYGLSQAQMKKALKAQNLTIRKFHAPKFEFVEEGSEDTNEEFQADIAAEVASIEAESLVEATDPPPPLIEEPETEEEPAIEEEIVAQSW